MSMYVNTGFARGTILKVTKTIGDISTTNEYSILDPIPETTPYSSFAAINELDFRKLTNSAYSSRLQAFYNYITSQEDGKDFSSTVSVISTDNCPIGRSFIMYGMLYNNAAAFDINTFYSGETVAWRLPTALELYALTEDNYTNGGSLMSTRTAPEYNHPKWSYSWGTGQDNSTGFSVLPAGKRNAAPSLGFQEFGTHAHFWTGGANTADNTYNTGFRLNDPTIPMWQSAVSKTGGTAAFKRTGISIRLVSENLTGYDTNGDEGTFTDEQGNTYITKRIDVDLGAGLLGRVWMCENLKVTIVDGETIPLYSGTNMPLENDAPACYYPNDDIINK